MISMGASRLKVCSFDDSLAYHCVRKDGMDKKEHG
jgi:hypothetical protein